MDKNTNEKKLGFFSKIGYWAVGTLLVLTMLSIYFTCGLYAKYVVKFSYNDAAYVAGTGINEIDLVEPKATYHPESGDYTLDYTDEVTENDYIKVIPGVDIDKDPYIKLDLNPEVDFELYVQVIKSDKFPSDTVKFELLDDWEIFDEAKGIYKYKYIISEECKKTIHILKDSKLIVSEHYEGKGQSFTLSFNAWLKQVEPD